MARRLAKTLKTPLPKGKDQRNFTDPESKTMKTSNKGFDRPGRTDQDASIASSHFKERGFPWQSNRSQRCGNAQAVANEQQIIVAADVTNHANDMQQVAPMIEQTQENLGAVGVQEQPKEFLADAGYFSEENAKTVEAARMNPFIATQRLKHNETIPDAPKGRTPKHLSSKQHMARKQCTRKGRETYSKRKWMIEPVFGQIKPCRLFRTFSLRGLQQMQGEWTLVCLTHNLLN